MNVSSIVGILRSLRLRFGSDVIANSRAYKKPRIFYLLEAFGFEGKRLLLDKNFEDLEEQVIFAIIEYVRLSGSRITQF